MQKSEDELMKQKIIDIIRNLSDSEKTILWKILKAERDLLYMSKPRGIYDEITKAIQEEIK
jgi:hypothetical protein